MGRREGRARQGLVAWGHRRGGRMFSQPVWKCGSVTRWTQVTEAGGTTEMASEHGGGILSISAPGERGNCRGEVNVARARV